MNIKFYNGIRLQEYEVKVSQKATLKEFIQQISLKLGVPSKKLQVFDNGIQIQSEDKIQYKDYRVYTINDQINITLRLQDGKFVEIPYQSTDLIGDIFEHAEQFLKHEKRQQQLNQFNLFITRDKQENQIQLNQNMIGDIFKNNDIIDVKQIFSEYELSVAWLNIQHTIKIKLDAQVKTIKDQLGINFDNVKFVVNGEKEITDLNVLIKDTLLQDQDVITIIQVAQ